METQWIQLSMFDDLGRIEQEDWFQERFRESVHRGSGYEGGKLRIFAAAETKDRDRLADFLQEEYGVGGNSIRDGFCDYDRRGMVIRKWKTNEEKRYPWWRVRDEVLRQIRAGEFLTKEEERQFREICGKRNGEIAHPKPRMHYE